MNQCECGCGSVIADDKRFVHNHHWKGKKFSATHKANIGAALKGRPPTVPAGTSTIDWQSLVIGHNRMFGTVFKNEKELYLGMYQVLPVWKIADRLGVAKDTLYYRFDFYGIKRRSSQVGIEKSFLSIPEEIMKNTTAAVLAKFFNVHVTTIYKLMRKTGRTYLRKCKGEYDKSAFLSMPAVVMQEMTAKTLAKHFGVHITTVRSWLKQAGRSCLRIRAW